MTTPMPAPVREIGYASDGAYWWASAEREPNPDLRWPHSVAVYDAMRRQDSQVRSVLQAVTLPVRRTTWSVDPAGADPEVARFVADNLGLPVLGEDPRPLPRLRGRFSWSDHLRHAMLKLAFGHMPFEQVYRIGDDGRAYLRKLAPRMPHTLSNIEVAPDGGLVAIEQHGVAATGKAVRIPVDRLVMYVHEREGGDWFGQSLLRSCYKNWLIKDRLLRVQAQTIERNGMGVPIYTATPEGDDFEKGRKLAQGFRSGESAGGAIPNEATLELMGVKGTLPDAEAAIRYHDEQIGRSVLAHFLNLGTQTGSWALGTTFSDFFVMSLQTVAQDVADVANGHVVEDLVDVNFGPDTPSPRLVFQEIGTRHQATADAIAMLVNAGVFIREPALERYLRSVYGIPNPEWTPTRQDDDEPDTTG